MNGFVLLAVVVVFLLDSVNNRRVGWLTVSCALTFTSLAVFLELYKRSVEMSGTRSEKRTTTFTVLL